MRVIKYILGSLVSVAMVGAFAVFVLDIRPWRTISAGEPKGRAPKRAPEAVALVEDKPSWYEITDRSLAALRDAKPPVPESVRTKLEALKDQMFERRDLFDAELHRLLGADDLKSYQDAILRVAARVFTLQLPDDVRRSLGIAQGGGEDALAPAREPKRTRPLVMPGTTALDPSRIMPIRARFAPADVVSITEVEDKPQPVDSMKPDTHELRPGDEVRPSMELATFYSPDAGNKKNDLYESVIQERLDKIILDKAEAASGVLADIYIWTARRNYDTDRSNVRRARNTLLTWGIDRKEIEAIEKEAREVPILEGRRPEVPEEDWAKAHEKWARVVLKAPDFKGTETAVVVERNVAKGEIVIDTTTRLFTLAQVDQLMVVVNCPEDDLPALYKLRDARMKQGARVKWAIHTVGADPVVGIEGTVAEFGWLIDPNQHTAVVKGYIPNPGGKIRAGQFASASVELLPPEGVVEIPIDALVEDGRQSVVFVQADADKHQYTMHRVDVVSRFEKTAYVRSTDVEPKTDKEREQAEEEHRQGLLPKKPLTAKDKVLTAGVLELKAAVLDKEAAPRGEN